MTETPSLIDSSNETDLAYLRRMTTAGRGAPAPFLLLMAVFGGAYGLFALVTSGVVLVETAGGVWEPLPGSASQVVGTWGFVAANVVFVIATAWTLWQMFSPRRVAVSRAASAIWSAAFVASIAVIGAVAVSIGHHHPAVLPEAVPSILLILWGCAWWAIAIVGERRWLLAVAVGSFGAAVALPSVLGSVWGLPLLAVCLLGLALLPAVLLIRERAH